MTQVSGYKAVNGWHPGDINVGNLSSGIPRRRDLVRKRTKERIYDNIDQKRVPLFR